jgi:hypothetical protein
LFREGDFVIYKPYYKCPYYYLGRGPHYNNVGQMMYLEGHSYYILDCEDGDVNGDRVRDSVCTVGHRPGDLQSPFVEDITLLIQDGVTHKYTRIPLKENQGYDPIVFLGDFTGDKVNDILVSINSGGSGGFSFDYVYSFLDNEPKLLFDAEEFSEKYKYEVNYRDYYKVEVASIAMKQKYIIDISLKGADYLNEIYNSNGTLKAPLQGEVIPMGNVYPIDFQRDKQYELNVIQRIIGRYGADTLALLNTILKWNGEQFDLDMQFISVWGSDMV